ncbi:translation initiation factor IF-2-like isoform X2 [Panthera uncia]|uniref:translation initiation factor IF-2-like isoform X2 n=1 Tax=Panthera uncia TaxID=29064 RepID=UPI0020FFA427|nr:translation initiation factor IF-2-like isoform X2 [Panthera uncia]
MSRGHADALRAGAARASRAAAAPLRTPDSASRRRPPALLAASSGPPLSGGIPNAGGPRPAPRRGGSAPPRTGADPEAGRTRGLQRASPLPRLPEDSMGAEAVLVCKLAPGHSRQGETKKEADLSRWEKTTETSPHREDF